MVKQVRETFTLAQTPQPAVEYRIPAPPGELNAALMTEIPRPARQLLVWMVGRPTGWIGGALVHGESVNTHYRISFMSRFDGKVKVPRFLSRW